MNRIEIRKAIKKANKVYAWVNDTEHDGRYIEVVKKNLILIYDKDFPLDININATLRSDNDLYIN